MIVHYMKWGIIKIMYILGIGGYYHDSSACLIKDGEIIAAAEEERFNRIKHSKGFPAQAVDYCLSTAGIGLDEVSHIGYYWNPWLWLKSRLAYRAKTFLRSPFYSAADIFNIAYNGFLPLLELKAFNQGKAKIHLVNHHLAHAASAFFVSPYDEALILSMDFFGENTTTYVAHGKANNIRSIQEIKYPHSLGALYSSITQYLGFEVDEGEYKVMGLASYGQPRFYNDMKKLVTILPNGAFRLNMSYFNYQITGWSKTKYVSNKFIELFGPSREPGSSISQKHMDLAASLQKLLEELVFHLLENIYKSHKLDSLCIAGGVGLNCALNGKLLNLSPFKNIFIQPAAGDSGCSLGAAYYIYNNVLHNKRGQSQESVFYGPEFSDEEIKAELEQNKLTYERHNNIEKKTAELLSKDKIIGWFQGRMEWGPRALGNRCILANPSTAEMKDLVNRVVKRREEFRPFAPSVLEEEASDYFEISDPSPFMMFIYKVKEEVKNKIPAITHIDGTARVQTVNKNISPRYWKLISEFKKITGIPMVLNTSFNLRGEPIVCTPRDAIRTFYSSGIDYLALGNYLVGKESDG